MGMETTTQSTKRLYTLLSTDDGGYIRHHWRTTEADAIRYAERYACPGDLLVGPRGETLIRYP